MGTNSKTHRYREQGQEANSYNVAKYGQPKRSLFSETKFFTLHHTMRINDEKGNLCYKARTNFFTIHDHTVVRDKDDKLICTIRRKFFTLHERRFIKMADGTEFQLSNEIFHIIKDITNIVGLDWILKGNVLGLNFQLMTKDEKPVAIVSQKMFSLHDKYCVDIYDDKEEDKIVAILVGLQHMIKERAAAASAASSSSNH